MGSLYKSILYFGWIDFLRLCSLFDGLSLPQLSVLDESGTAENKVE